MDKYLNLLVAGLYDEATQFAMTHTEVYTGGLDIRYKMKKGISVWGVPIEIQMDCAVNMYNLNQISLEEVDSLVRRLRLEATKDNGKFEGFIDIEFLKDLIF